jgi:hypothetical protein
MHMPRLVPAVVAAALSLVPFGRAYAQDVDQQAVLVGKLCNELRDPVSLPWVRGLGSYPHYAMLDTVTNLLLFFKYLREKQLALEAEAQLNVIELGIESEKAKEVLDRIRKKPAGPSTAGRRQSETGGSPVCSRLPKAVR